MLISTIKFLHLLSAVSLISLTLFCCSNSFLKNKISYKIIVCSLLLSSLALLTGTFLVHPSGFTFTTTWIQAAYGLVIFFILQNLTILYNKKYNNLLMICFSIGILILVVHGAVCKSLLFPLKTLTRYNAIKIFHILSASCLAAIIGYCVYAWYKRKNVFNLVVWVIPLALIQSVSGFTMLSIKPYSFNELWVKVSVLSFLAFTMAWLAFMYVLFSPQKRFYQFIWLTFSLVALSNMIFFMATK